MGGGQLRPAPRDRPGLEPTHLRTLEEDRRRLLAGQRQKMNPTSSRQKKMAGGMNPPETRATLIALVAEDAHAATAAASRVGGDAVPFVRHHLYQVGRCEAAFEIPIGRTFPGQRAGAGWGLHRRPCLCPGHPASRRSRGVGGAGSRGDPRWCRRFSRPLTTNEAACIVASNEVGRDDDACCHRVPPVRYTEIISMTSSFTLVSSNRA